LCTTRKGGHSVAPFDGFNLATHVGDNPGAVVKNRFELSRYLPGEPVWLNQTHTNKVIELVSCQPMSQGVREPFDGSFTRKPHMVCTVMTADCLPILLTDKQGSFVATVHAGWRGLANGIIANALAHISSEHQILAWLGPAISQKHFEVGDDVRETFLALSATHQHAFIRARSSTINKTSTNKWFADIYRLATIQLNLLGVDHIYGGNYCTYEQSERFHSYRRDGEGGRMASCIWIEN
jgi:YfiH family protein